MVARAFLPISAALLSFALTVPASAQVAAETATILSGTGQSTGSAARGMGSAVSGSMNRAASQIRAAQSGVSVPRRGRSRNAQAGYDIPADADMLEGTDAPTYQLGNGASIRTSGSLRRSGAAICSENCANSPDPTESAPQP